MKINKYIVELRKQIRETADAKERNALTIKMRYAIAHMKGADALERYRGNLIAREIGKKYDINAQIAVLANKDTNYVEYMAFQEYRTSCKANVDETIAALKAEIEEKLR
jgi:hypothetical protein